MTENPKSNKELYSEIESLKKEVEEYKSKLEQIENSNNDISSDSFILDSKMFTEVYSQVISNLPVPAYLISSKGAFVACNNMFQDFLIKDEKEVIAASPRDIFPAEIGERTIYFNEAEQKELNFTSYDIVNIKRNEEIKTVIVCETVYKDIDGSPLGILGVFNDITEKTKAEDKLRESEQKTRELNDIKDQFFHIVSHDLKSPFSALLGFSQLLVEDYDELDEDDKRNFIDRINSTANFSFKMLSNLQLWSKLSLNKMPIENEIVNPIEVLNSVIELQQSHINEKNINVKIESSCDTSIFIDRSMLEIIFENLLSNAVNFSDENSNIEIYFKDENENLIIEFLDHGIGLSLEDQAKLFKIEIHTVKIGQKKTKGTGLGLILCKLIVEEYEGSISVMSKLEKGTKVTVKLPKHSS